jgi:transcriptional regulator with XRE-family HTH domain
VKSDKHKDSLVLFGKHLKRIREEKGFSQEDLAYDADLSISQISRIERGIINTSLLQLIAIAETLKVPLKKLVDFT